MQLHIIALRGVQRQGHTGQQVDNVLPRAASHSYGGGRMSRFDLRRVGGRRWFGWTLEVMPVGSRSYSRYR